MNGKNGNILEGYYANRNKPNWSLVISCCTLILALLAIIYYTLEKNTDLKIEVLRRDAKIYILENSQPVARPGKE